MKIEFQNYWFDVKNGFVLLSIDLRLAAQYRMGWFKFIFFGVGLFIRWGKI